MGVCVGMVTADVSCPTSLKFLNGLALRHHVCHFRLDVEHVRIMDCFTPVATCLADYLRGGERSSLFLNAKARPTIGR